MAPKNTLEKVLLNASTSIKWENANELLHMIVFLHYVILTITSIHIKRCAIKSSSSGTVCGGGKMHTGDPTKRQAQLQTSTKDTNVKRH